MGTPDFAAKHLERLYNDGTEIAGVFTKPDMPRDRGMKLSLSPVKELAVERGTPVHQPASLRDGSIENLIRGLECDLIVVVAYGRLLPARILSVPPLGCINIHASLLPKYRGAAPIQWAVLNGEKVTGVTSMYISEELDTGDKILAADTAIGEDETAGELYGRLKEIGAELLSETVKAISGGIAIRVPQDHREATYAPPLSKDLSPIDWSETAHKIKCKVRGLNPWPVATAVIGGETLKVFSVDICCKLSGRPPGEIVSAGGGGIEIACADGTVTIKQLQAPGRKRMMAAEYLKGHTVL